MTSTPSRDRDPMRRRSLVPALLLAVGLAACGGGDGPGADAGDRAAAVANLQTEPDPMSAEDAECVVNSVGAGNLAVVDNFSTAFREAYDEDESSVDDAEQVGRLIDQAVRDCFMTEPEPADDDGLVTDQPTDIADGPADCDAGEGEGCAYGDDPDLDTLYDSCEAGDLADCDTLYFTSAIGSEYEAFGAVCGGEQPDGTGGTCESGPVDDLSPEESIEAIDCSTVDGPCDYGDDATLDALWDDCEGGDLAACDDLFLDSGIGTRYEQFGDTCGARNLPRGFCDTE